MPKKKMSLPSRCLRAQRLREMRIAKGMDRKELADRMGISQQHVAALESERDGSPEPSVKTLVKLVEVLDLGPHELYDLVVLKKDYSTTRYTSEDVRGLLSEIGQCGRMITRRDLEFLLETQDRFPMVLSRKLIRTIIDEQGSAQKSG